MKAPIPSNEARRIEALRRYRLLDTPAEKVFDDITFVASVIAETPMASMTLVDSDRQWFKSRIGIPRSESPREDSFCGHAILGHRPLVIEDATKDARFAENPMVTGDPHIRFYAGAPLLDEGGLGLGSLCVIDRKPRHLSARQEEALEALARDAMAHIRLRHASAELAAALEELRTVNGLLPICSHCKDIRNDKGYWLEVEDYVQQHSEADFSHGICPACMKTKHPEVYSRMQSSRCPS